VRHHRAGDTIEDACRACKLDRLHTIIVMDGDRPLRVRCDYCGSQHNYRGGGREAPARDRGRDPAEPVPVRGHAASPPHGGGAPPPSRQPFPLISDRERVAAPFAMDTATTTDLELLLRRILREEAGVTPVVPAEKWRGGTLVVRPANPALQEKTWPIEALFHKVVMIRNRLRTLEQQLNAADLPEDLKLKLQAYVTGCYGSLTSFNLLFADEADQFSGSAE
jgi:hypothetical protein